jgi:hypothetical protein
MQASYCGNTECKWNSQKKGGEFIYSRERGMLLCPDCFYERSQRLPSVAKSAFDFVTTTINGKPIHVESMQHLQRLEKEHGCSSVVLNCDRSNWGSPKMPRENWQQKVTPMRGIEAGIGRPQEGRR